MVSVLNSTGNDSSNNMLFGPDGIMIAFEE